MKRLLLSLSLLSAIAQAQEITPSVIHSNGGFALVSGNTIEWNVGESVVATLPSSNGISITSGQLQPMDVIIQVEEAQSSNVVIYPVPAMNELTIRSEEHIEQVRVFDSTGRLVLEERPSQLLIQIDVSALSAGVYQLVLIQSTNHILYTKSFSKAN